MAASENSTVDEEYFEDDGIHRVHVTPEYLFRTLNKHGLCFFVL